MSDQANPSPEAIDLASRRTAADLPPVADVRPPGRSRGKKVAIFAAFAVVIVAFIIIDSDEGARQGLATAWDNVTGFVTGRGEPAAPANWGDVAAKVGEFAEEERTLRQTLSPAMGVQPQPTPAAVP